MNPWIINAKPKDDELLSSWLIRTAIANGDDPIGLVQKFWGKWRAWTTDLDRLCPNDKALTLARVAGLRESEILSMTLQPTIETTENNKKLNPKQQWHWVIPNGKRNRTATNGLHYCPECISESTVYFRKSWRLAWNVACPTHKTLLVINCPECHTVISPHLVTYKKTSLHHCTHCGYDLRKALTFVANDEALELQELLNKSLANDNKYELPLGIKTSHELFSTTLFFMRFFYSLRRYKKNYNYLIVALGLTEESKVVSLSKGTTIESLHVLNRQFLLLVTSRLFQLEFDDIVKLFQEAQITQQRLNATTHHSILIKKLGSHLVNIEKKVIKRAVVEKTIEPRSKEEVEQLMNEIRSYL